MNERARSWRVGHRGRDGMYYEERRWGAWRRIEIEGEMLMGRAHHVIYFASPGDWQRYPEWARHRRTEIIARIKSELRPPDYEYDGDGGGESPPLAVRVASAAPPRSAAARSRMALALAAGLLLILSAAMGWLVKSSLDTGTTTFPSTRPSQQRPVSRHEEPMTFRLAVGLYALIGAGSGGLALWGIRAGWRS